jgi:5-methylcytosine-specific restriction endonuclease McrA
MKGKQRPNLRLLATANAVAKELRVHCKGTCLRIRMPRRGVSTNTEGWCARIGDSGKGGAKLEIWFDRFSGQRERRFYAGFFSENRRSIAAITSRVSQKLEPIRQVHADDLKEGRSVSLKKPLNRAGFRAPIIEKYPQGRTYYGIFDPSLETEQRVDSRFCERAVDFFDEVARILPHSPIVDETRDIYPQNENRRIVASHLQRERSRLLARACKERDKYKCRICGTRFENVYGEIGRLFAEAHHLVPLKDLPKLVITKLEDLITVCSNCHRMLHVMDGLRGDIKKLRGLVRRHRCGCIR